jgi:CubicO group peptidase (beta-lactamase class C family)
MSISITVKPESVGFASQRLARINQLFRDYVDGNKLAGTLGVVARRGEIVYADRHGLRDREAGLPMELDTIVRIYSMTKPITTVAAMMLYEDGHFMLDTPVSQLIPAFAETRVLTGTRKASPILEAPTRPVTIKDLMLHTAGLSYGWFQDTPVDRMYSETGLWEMEGGLEEWVNALAALPLCFHPGTGWRYSFATDVLGRVVEVASGKSLGAFLADEIFRPLGMVDTAFQVEPAKQDRFAALYSLYETLDFSGALPAPDEPVLHCLERTNHSRYCRSPAFESGGGGLTGTAADYLRFAQMMLNGGVLDGHRLLGRKTVELMMLNHLPEELIPIAVGDDPAYGFGFGLGGSVLVDVAASNVPGSVGAWGWSGAAATHFWVDPREELIGIFATQFMPSSHYPVQWEFRKAVYQALVD